MEMGPYPVRYFLLWAKGAFICLAMGDKLTSVKVLLDLQVRRKQFAGYMGRHDNRLRNALYILHTVRLNRLSVYRWILDRRCTMLLQLWMDSPEDRRNSNDNHLLALGTSVPTINNSCMANINTIKRSRFVRQCVLPSLHGVFYRFKPNWICWYDYCVCLLKHYLPFKWKINETATWSLWQFWRRY